MYNKIFKPLQVEGTYINLCQFRIYDLIIPSHCIIYNAVEEKTLYICTRFPNYGGRAENVELHVSWFDYEMHTIGDCVLKNCEVSIALFNAWRLASCPKAHKIVHHLDMHDYANMMRHSRAKKKGTGGVLINERVESMTTDAIGYKQVTEYAYHENMRNSRSGNASVVASSIR